MLESLLSTFEGEELWSNITSVMPVFEKLTEALVKNMQAENGEKTKRHNRHKNKSCRQTGDSSRESMFK